MVSEFEELEWSSGCSNVDQATSAIVFSSSPMNIGGDFVLNALEMLDKHKSAHNNLIMANSPMSEQK